MNSPTLVSVDTAMNLPDLETGDYVLAVGATPAGFEALASGTVSSKAWAVSHMVYRLDPFSAENERAVAPYSLGAAAPCLMLRIAGAYWPPDGAWGPGQRTLTGALYVGPWIRTVDAGPTGRYVTTATSSVATSSTATCPSVTADWTDPHNLFVAVVAAAGATVTGWPTGYSNTQQVTSGGLTVAIATWNRDYDGPNRLLADQMRTEQPPPFTLSASVPYQTTTLAIRPADPARPATTAAGGRWSADVV